MLKGKILGLVSLEKADLKQLLDWRNNSEFRKYFREYRELNMMMQKRWFEEKILNDPAIMMFAIRRLSDNRLLGCCGFVYINWVYRHADLSLYIGWNNCYIDDKGYAKEACRLMFSYGFDQLNLNKIWTEIYIFDRKKKKLFDTFGFKKDGVLRQNCFYEGKFWDSYILSMLAREWRKRVMH